LLYPLTREAVSYLTQECRTYCNDKWNIRDFNDIVGNTGQDMKMNPMDYAIINSHILKTAAILKKIANIFPAKCYQKCNGLYQIN
jgi:tRNA G37 N-methylase TrmD